MGSEKPRNVVGLSYHAACYMQVKQGCLSLQCDQSDYLLGDLELDDERDLDLFLHNIYGT